MEPKIVELNETTYPFIFMEKVEWLNKPELEKDATEFIRIMNDLTKEKIHKL